VPPVDEVGLRLDVLEKLGDQTALADARDTDERNELRRVLLPRPLECVDELVESFTAIRTCTPACSRVQSRIASAARTARSGSSSCATGAPNNAITASPMNFSTVPPNRSSSARSRS